MITPFFEDINTNLLQTNNHILILYKLPKLQFTVTGVTIPGVVAGSIRIPTPHHNVNYPGTSIDFGDLSFTFIIDSELNNYQCLFDWILLAKEDSPLSSQEKADILNRTDMSEFSDENYYSDAVLFMTNNNKVIKKKFNFINCFPLSLSSFDVVTTGGSEVLVCTALFAVDRFNLKSI